jgi:hypothetical protein
LPSFIVKKKWDLAKAAAFPDSVPPNIVMISDTTKEDQEKLRRAIEEKRKAEAQNPQQSQIDALRAMAAQQYVPLAQEAARMAQMQQQYGTALGGIAGLGQASSFPFVTTSQIFQSPFAQQYTPPAPAVPAAPDKTTEEAQRDLTETGRRKIILDSE